MSQSRPSLQSVLQRLRQAHGELLRRSHGDDEQRATLDDMLAMLARDFPEENGSILLDDGSRLHISPERGDRSEETGRIAAIQRFDDGRPEFIHLITD